MPWSIVDLGALGGTTAYAFKINDAGTVAGNSGSAAFVWTEAGGMIDIGTLGGSVVVRAISRQDQVIGFSWLGPLGASPYHAYSWTAAFGLIDLGTLGGATSEAIAVNGLGQVVGRADTGDGAMHPFLWSAGGGMIDLGTLGGRSAAARGINDRGEIVGIDYTLGHGFFRTAAGDMIDIGPVDVSGMGTVYVNNSSVVAGTAVYDDGSNRRHGFVWTAAGGMRDIGTLGGDQLLVFALSDSGQVVGQAQIAPAGATHAFSWTDSTSMLDLGTFGGLGSSATAVNVAGKVVGRADTTDGPSHAFVWTHADGLVDLGTLGGASSFAYDINAGATVAGASMTADAATHATLWHPPAVYAAAIQPPIRSDGSSVLRANRGTVPIKFTLTLNGAPTCDLPQATIALAGITGLFRVDATSCQYMYHLDVRSLGPGTYNVQMLIDAAVVGTGTFRVQ